MNKNIIIAILIVIIIAIVAFFAFSQPATTDGKLNTQINFLSQDTLKNGEQIQFELKDAQGNVLAGQKVNISYSDKGNVQNYSIYTDNAGKGYLTINGEAAGQYEVTVTYGGDAKYNGCSAKKTITVEEGTTTEAVTNTTANSTTSTVAYNNGTSSSQNSASSSSQATSSQSYYDADLNVYFDQNGKVIGGQNPGANIWELRNNHPQIDEDGSLV
ncbi:MAG: Ig-like domain-containing protein [Methanobrevibacter sp.]|nr:Ig-like domain-containing protein [Methanobrevibacter sp.]